MRPEDPESARWFADEVQPHEAMLRAWLRSRFGAMDDVDDCVQEAYARVLRAREKGLIQSPKAYLFATARNVVLDRIRHYWVTGGDSLAEIDRPDVMDEGSDVFEEVARAEELELLTQAIQSLPARCRQVLTLRKIYGVSQKDIAAQLGIAEHTVEAQQVIGLRKIARFLGRHERRGAAS